MASVMALFLAGCAGAGGGLGTGSSGSGPLAVSQAAMKGTVHGGKQAIYNATVTLYAMNTTTANYGDTPIQYAQTKTGFDGSFSFVKGVDGVAPSGVLPLYSCPANASTGVAGSADNPEMYLVASGGDTSGSINAGNTGSAYDNAAAKLILAIGDCNSLSASTHLVMNEVTTVGTMVALEQFFNPMTESIGAPTTNISGLRNAVAMMDNLVDRTTGVAQQGTTPASTVPGVTMSATAEYQKLNTMANILATCVSSSSSGSAACTALKNNAVPPSSASVTNFPSITTYPDATDTLLAVDYMNINPTESQDYLAGSGKLFNLYSLPNSATAPFQPALTAQPMDWTVGVSFVPSGTCTNLSTPVSPFSASGVYSIVIDQDGYPWFSSWGSDDVMGQLTPAGGVINCMSGRSSNNTAGRRMAIDSRGNVWWATTQGMIEYVRDSSNTAVGTILVHAQPTGIKASGVAADQNGNIYVVPDATAGFAYQYPNAATASTAISASSIVTLGSVSMNSAAVPYRDLVVNAAGNLFTEGSGSTSHYVYAYFNNSGTYTNSQLTGITAGVGTPRGLAGDMNGNAVGGNACCARSGYLYKLSGVDGSLLSNSPGLNAGGNGSDYSVAVDGANNIWSGGGNFTNPDLTIIPVAETDANYNPLSPQGDTLTYIASSVTWTPGNCGGTPATCAPNGGFQKSWYTGSITGIAVDGSGNVWTSSGSASPKNIVTVIVGAAVPVKTPIVNNLH